jgi:hypothetical protein
MQMKKSVFVILLCLSACRMALGSIAYVSGSATTCLQTSSSTTSQTCTLAGATTAGNTIKVGLAWKTTTASVSSVKATGCNFFPYKNTTSNGSSESVAVWIGQNCPSISSVTVTLSAGSVWVTTVNEYSGVVAIGQVTSATGSSANPSVSITLQDANDWVVMESASIGSDGVPTANTGNLRSANLTGSTSSDVAAGACDNTASSGSVTCADSITSSAWAAIGIELRTANPADPLLVDAVGTGSNGYSEVANGITFSLPQATLSGNSVICGLSYPYSSGRTVSVTDNKSNTWDQAVSVGSTTNNMTVALWYTAAAAGTLSITVTFDTALYGIQFACKEAYNIVTSSPLDGTASVASSTTSTVATSSITTSSNGDLIFEYGNYIGEMPLYDQTTSVNAFAAGPGWSPIIADTVTGEFFQDIQQASAGSITPTYDVEVVSGYPNIWGAVAAAFKTSTSQGTLPPSSGLHIDHLFAETTGGAGTVLSVQFPADGNFLAMASSYNSTVNDSLQNSYTQNLPGGAGTQTALQYAQNANSRLGGLLINVSGTPYSADDMVWMDIRGAATVSAIDTTAFNAQTQPVLTNGYNWSGMPTITPSAAGELIIADLPTGCGPTSVASAPAGAITDNVYYSGETDLSNFNQACGHAHFVTTSTAQESWTWVMENASCASSGGNSSASAAWAIKAAALTAKSVTPAHATIF